MSPNLGTIDRIARILAGAALLAVAFATNLLTSASPVLQIGAAAVGGILLATAFIRLCPLYALLGISTCKIK